MSYSPGNNLEKAMHLSAGDRLGRYEIVEPLGAGGMTTPSVYVALGDIDGAFRTLEQGYEIRSPWLPWLGVDFLYEPLRGDPRLEDLLRRMD